MYTEEYQTLTGFQVNFHCLTVNVCGKQKNEEQYANQNHKKRNVELLLYYCSLEREIFIKRKAKKDFMSWNFGDGNNKHRRKGRLLRAT